MSKTEKKSPCCQMPYQAYGGVVVHHRIEGVHIRVFAVALCACYALEDCLQSYYAGHSIDLQSVERVTVERFPTLAAAEAKALSAAREAAEHSGKPLGITRKQRN